MKNSRLPRLFASSSRAPRPLSASIATLLPVLSLLVAANGLAQTITGTGYKGVTNSGTANTGLWSASTNWDSTGPAANERNLFFGQGYKAAGGTNTIAKNDIAGYQGYRITFQDSNAAGTGTDGTSANDTAFTITGNGFTLFDFGSGNFPRIQNDSFLTQTFTLTTGQTIVLNDSANSKAEINAVNGDLVFSAGTKIDLAGTTQLQIFGNNGKNLTFNDVISSSGNSGANSVALNQNSVVTYGAANTYSGDTFINAGTLQFISGSANNSILRLGDTVANSGAATLNIGTVAGGTTISSTINLRSSASGTQGTRAISGTNTSGTNTYSGVVALDAIATVTSTTFGGTLAFTGSSFQLKTFGVLFNGAGNITVSGPITSTGAGNALTKSGTGTLTLTGANTYDGATTIFATGGTLQLGNGSTTGKLSTSSAISIGSSSTFAINRSDTVVQGTDFSSAAITGAGGFTQSGAGTTTLNAVNGYTGPTTISNGILRVAGGVAIADTSAVVIALGALFDLNSTSETVGSLATGGLISLGSGTLTTGGNNTTTTSAAFIYGTGGVAKTGTGVQTLSFAGNTNTSNFFSGGLTLASGGGLTISGTNAAGTGAITTSGALTISAGQIYETGGITINGGTTTLSGANSGGVGTVLLNAGGTLAVSNASALQNNTLNLAAGTFNPGNGASIGALTGSTGFTLGTGTYTLGYNNSSPAAYTGNLSGATAANLSKVGTGTQVLNGTSNFTGTITVNGAGGALEIGGQSSGNGNVAVQSGTLRENFNSSAVATDLVKSAALSLSGGTLAIVGKNSSTNSLQNFTGTTLTSGTASTVSVTNGNSTGTAAVNLNTGLTRNAGSALNVVLPSGTQTATNGVLTTTGTASSILVPGSGAAYATVGGTDFAAKDSTNTLIVPYSTVGSYNTASSSSLGTSTQNSDINGTDPTLAGAATINTIRFSDSAARTLTMGGVTTVSAGGVLVSSALTTAGSRITGGTLTSGTGAAEVIVHQFSAQPFTIDSVIVNANAGATATALTKDGPGTLILTKANTISGITYVDSGTLLIGTGGSLASSTVNLSPNDTTAVFDLSNQTTSVAGITGGSSAGVISGISSGGYVNLGSTGVLTITSGGQTSTPFVGGSGAIVNKTGASTLGFSGSSQLAFNGTFNVNAGVLSTNNASVNLQNANVVLGSGGALTLSATTLSVGNISGAGPINGSVNGAATLSFGFVGGSPTAASGIIANNSATNTLALSKFGSGTSTLAGANTYTGGTTINSGNLVFDYSGGSDATGATPGTLISNGGTVTFRGAATGTTADTTSGAFGLGSGGFAGRLVLDSNGGSGILQTLTTTAAGFTAGNASDGLLIDTSSSAGNHLYANATISNADATNTSNIRISNGLLATGLGTASLNNYRANILIKDIVGYGYATTSGTGASTEIVRYTGVTTLTTASGSLDTTNFKVANSGVTLSTQLLFNTLQLDSSTAPVSLTNGAGQRFGNGSASVSGRSILVTGSNGATLTGNGGSTNQVLYINNYQTGTTAGQTFNFDLISPATLYTNGTGLTVATQLDSGTLFIQSGVFRMAVAQATGDALTGGASVINLNGGVLEIGADLTSVASATSTADFSRTVGTGATQVSLIGDTGFSAFGGTRTVNLGGLGTSLNWGQDNFLTVSGNNIDGNATFKLSSAFSDSTIEFQNGINLNSSNRTIEVADGSASVDARITGVIANTNISSSTYFVANTQGSLNKTGLGTLELTAANNYNGPTTVVAGTLLLSNTLALQNSTLVPRTSGVLFNSTVTANGNAFTVGGLSGAASGNDLVLQNNAGSPAAVALTIGNNNKSETYAGSLSGTGSLTKVGTGTQTLSGANSFIGSTTVSNGVLSASVANALQSTTSVAINSGGTLLLAGAGAIDRVNNSATVALAGGTLSTSGLSSSSETFGALTLSGNSTINFGTGNGNTLTFASLSGFSGTLTVNGWSGSFYSLSATTDPNTDATQDRLVFTANPNLTTTQLSNINFYGDNGSFIGNGLQVGFNSAFEVVPVPEPSTWVGAGLITGLAGWSQRKRLGKLVA